MEVEAKKMAAEVSAMDKEVDAMCVDEEQGNRAKRIWRSQCSMNSSQINPVGYTLFFPLFFITAYI